MNHEELVAKAKATLITKPKATKENPKAIEASDPTLINELLAERQHLADEVKLLTARKEEIDAVFKDIIADKNELLVHGAKVASIIREKDSIVVNTDEVKDEFPFEQYPTLYKKRKGATRLYIH